MKWKVITRHVSAIQVFVKYKDISLLTVSHKSIEMGADGMNIPFDMWGFNMFPISRQFHYKNLIVSKNGALEGPQEHHIFGRRRTVIWELKFLS